MRCLDEALRKVVAVHYLSASGTERLGATATLFRFCTCILSAQRVLFPIYAPFSFFLFSFLIK